MKRSFCIATAALALAATGASAEDIQYINMNGCNVMQLDIFPSKQVGEYEYNAKCSGNGVGVGLIGKSNDGAWKGKSLVIGENVGNNVIYDWQIQWPLQNGGGWYLWRSTDGVHFTLANHSTYTIGAPDALVRR